MRYKIIKLKTVNSLAGYSRYKTRNDQAQSKALEKLRDKRRN
tara:strand:- start:800 stop:925 length:126 start_codon:yes stop_codon:yes gene_type:complete